jgi:hypothetical protein
MINRLYYRSIPQELQILPFRKHHAALLTAIDCRIVGGFILA